MLVQKLILQRSSAPIVGYFGEVCQMDECLLLVLEGAENDDVLAKQLLRAVGGVSGVRARGDRLFFVSYDPMVVDHDVIIETTIKGGIKVRRFQHVPQELEVYQ